ncbi:MAG TPA: HAD family hydrolase [Blastocatellia bacterium]|nr:HAD family hydrolase [Blastocatellia bacterium]
MAIKAISFDFWNTLFTEQPGGFTLYQQTRRRLLREAIREAGEFTDEQLDRACTLEAELHYQVWREEHRTIPTTERVGKILTHIEVCLPDDVLASLVSAYEEGVLERPPVLIAGVREAIGELAGNYRLGIISDVGFSPGRVLKEILRREGLLEAFDSLVFSDEAGRSKPHRSVFERTARMLAADPREIVHVGDLEYTDVVGAKAAGYHSIRFTGATPIDEDETTVADHVTDDFTDVPRLVAELAGR